MVERFLKDGRKVCVHGFIEESKEFVVSEILTAEDWDHESEYPSTQVFIVQELFKKAPMAVLDEDIVKRNEIIEDQRKQQNLIQKNIRELETEYEALLKRVSKRNDALKHIEAILDDKVAYFFDSTGSPRILTKTEALAIDDRYDRGKQKLLTLYGGTAGKFNWAINQYSDGSGYNHFVQPFLNLEEALVAAQKYLNSIQPSEDPSKSVVEFAKQWDLRLPDWYIPKLKDKLRSHYEYQIKDVRKNLERFEKELENSQNV